MNIFVLNKDPAIAAQMHFNKHVVKMPLETAQMLSTINNGRPYKATHKNHPCTIWAGQTVANYQWLVELGLALCKEYTIRYGKIHKCQAVIEMLRKPPSHVPFGRLTPFAQAMPEDVKHEDAVIAYQQYYVKYKRDIAEWKVRPIPEFMGAQLCS